MAAMGPSDSSSDVDSIFLEKDVVSEKGAIQFIQSTFDSDPSLLKLKKGSEYYINGKKATLAHSVIKDDVGNIYMITKNLGTGSYGNVKLGKNLNTNELVAIKVQHPSEGTAQAISEFEKQLKQEEHFIALFGRLKGTLKRRGSPQKGRKVTGLDADKKILKFYSVQTFLTGKELTKFLIKHPLLGGAHAHPSSVSSDNSSVKEEVDVPKDSSSEDKSLSVDAFHPVIQNDSDDQESFYGSVVINEDSLPAGSVVVNDDSQPLAMQQGAPKVVNPWAMQYAPETEINTYDPPNLSLPLFGLLFVIFNNATKELATIHQNGVLHLDIKPDNIFIDNDLNITFIDFGVSLNIPRQQNWVESGQIRGTPSYMAPEVSGGMYQGAGVVRYTPKTDVYSLGRTFKDMMSVLTNKTLIVPFQFNNPNNLLLIDTLNDISKVLNEMMDRNVNKRSNTQDVINAFSQVEKKLLVVLAAERLKSAHPSRVLEALVLLGQAKKANISLNEAIQFIDHCRVLDPKTVRSVVNPSLIHQVNGILSAKDAPLQSTAPNQDIQQRLENAAQAAQVMQDEPEHYLRTHPGDIVKALELLQAHEGGQLTQRKALVFAGECKRKNLINDYKGAVDYIRKKFR